MAKELALALTSEKNLFVWFKKDHLEPIRFNTGELKGQTWHYVADDSLTKTPKIFTADLIFSDSVDKVTIDTHEAGKSSETVSYTMVDGKYEIPVSASLSGSLLGFTLELKKIMGNKDMIIIVDDLEKPGLLTADKKFADSIVKKWTALTK